MNILARIVFSTSFIISANNAFAIDTSTKAPTTEHSRYFDTIDTNHDGFISKDEWRASGNKMFDAMDTNRDGKVSPEELKAYYAAKDAARDARHVKWVTDHSASAAASAK